MCAQVFLRMSTSSSTGDFVSGSDRKMARRNRAEPFSLLMRQAYYYCEPDAEAFPCGFELGLFITVPVLDIGAVVWLDVTP